MHINVIGELEPKRKSYIFEFTNLKRRGIRLFSLLAILMPVHYATDINLILQRFQK